MAVMTKAEWDAMYPESMWRGYMAEERRAQALYAHNAREMGLSGKDLIMPGYVPPDQVPRGEKPPDIEFTVMPEGGVPGFSVFRPTGAELVGKQSSSTQHIGLPTPSSSSSPSPSPSPSYSTSYSEPTYSEPTYSKSYSDRAHAAITTPRYTGNYSSVPESFMPSWMRGGSTPAPAPAPTENKGLLPALDREHSSVPEHLMPEWLRGRSSGMSDMIPPEWRGSTSGG